jgi:hypothetical protein
MGTAAGEQVTVVDVDRRVAVTSSESLLGA